MIEGRDYVIGVFEDGRAARDAIHALKDAGFRGDDISVLLPEQEPGRQFETETGVATTTGATTGALTGGVLGGVAGWLIGIGALAIPGVGPFIAAGPIMAALAGAGIGGSVGGVTGGLIGLGLPEYEAKRYDGRISRGDILISVHAENSDAEKRAKQILEDTGAEDISSTGEARSDYPEKKATTTL